VGRPGVQAITPESAIMMPERAIMMDWNWRSHSTGMRDHNGPDYATINCIQMDNVGSPRCILPADLTRGDATGLKESSMEQRQRQQ
jgi:hypothetical protein